MISNTFEEVPYNLKIVLSSYHVESTGLGGDGREGLEMDDP
jgi:hypothetical protein